MAIENKPGDLPESSDLSSTEALSIEEKVKRAIGTDNDLTIIQAWQPKYEQNTTVQQYIPRIEYAKKRLEARKQLCSALDTNDDLQIVKSFDPILNGYPLILPEEWQRLSEAVAFIFRSCSFGQKGNEQWLQATLLLRFVNACRVKNDEAIIKTFQAIKDAGYLLVLQLTEQEIDVVERAERRIAAHLQFQEALKNGDIRQVADTYDLILENDVQLRVLEQEQAELAIHFVYTFNAHLKDDDALVTAEEDKDLVSAYEAIEESPTLHLTTQELERVQQAKQRIADLKRVRSALQDGKLRKIVDEWAASPQLNKKHLRADERAKLQLAKRYIEALQARGNYHPTVLEIYQEIMASPYSKEFYFTPQEMPNTLSKTSGTSQQSGLAPEDETKLIATVDSTPIYYKQLWLVYLIKQQYIQLRQSQPNISRDISRWIQSQTGILKDLRTLSESDQQKVAMQAFDDIIHNFLMKKEISGLARRDRQELEQQHQKLFEAFKQRGGFIYHDFLQSKQLVDEDVKDVLAIYVRREFLTENLSRRRQPSIDIWLTNQRQTLVITYPESETADKHKGGTRWNPFKLVDWFGV